MAKGRLELSLPFFLTVQALVVSSLNEKTYHKGFKICFKHDLAPSLSTRRPMTSYKMIKMNGYKEDERKIVCSLCGKIMADIEPGNPAGEFFHSKRPNITCANDGKTFSFLPTMVDGVKVYETLPEGVSLFEKKAARRNTKKLARKARRARTY